MLGSRSVNDHGRGQLPESVQPRIPQIRADLPLDVARVSPRVSDPGAPGSLHCSRLVPRDEVRTFAAGPASTCQVAPHAAVDWLSKWHVLPCIAASGLVLPLKAHVHTRSRGARSLRYGNDGRATCNSTDAKRHLCRNRCRLSHARVICRAVPVRRLRRRRSGRRRPGRARRTSGGCRGTPAGSRRRRDCGPSSGTRPGLCARP